MSRRACNGYCTHHLTGFIIILIGLLLPQLLPAQDLDPRAYVRVPFNTRTIVGGYSYSYGDVVTDPTLPIKNIDATVQSFVLSYVHSFNLLGLSSQAMVALPHSWARVSGEVQNQSERISRSGFADARFRLSVLLLGAPAASLQELVKAPRKTILGVSINVIAPTGQFYPDKLINLGTHRFSFRPELAVSHPMGKRWLLDVYSGVWFFTANHSFYPGNSLRTQEPMGAFQGHISYNLRPRFWIAMNATFYVGGTSSINDIYNDDRQENARIGVTTVLPVGKRNSLKLSASKGAVVRIGQNFATFSIGWQTSWFGKLTTSEEKED
jgi:hypothetical protein